VTALLCIGALAVGYLAGVASVVGAFVAFAISEGPRD